jgi:hypothetical protein
MSMQQVYREKCAILGRDPKNPPDARRADSMRELFLWFADFGCACRENLPSSAVANEAEPKALAAKPDFRLVS